MNNEPIKLSELQQRIEQKLRASFSNNIWVTGEISDLSLNHSGHCYIEFIERDNRSDSIVARVRAIIWSKQARFILPYFKSTTGFDLEEGLSVLVKISVEYHPLYGLSLIISDIDPIYTLGDQLQKRNEILARLEADGVIDMNRSHNLPLHAANIAVISSAEAAGYGDFIDHIINNQYGYKYNITLFQATMQGKETRLTVSSSLDAIASEYEKFDIVAIVRGGGSQADLSWFDDYEIAFLISQFPLPVVSGIGHDRDQTVVDIVSHTACKTPTAVADFIISLSASTDLYLSSVSRKIVEKTRQMILSGKESARSYETRLSKSATVHINSARQGVDILSKLIERAAKQSVDLHSGKVKENATRLRTSVRNLIDRTGLIIKQLDKSFSLLNPYNTMKRGYSLSYLDGKPLLTTKNLKEGDKITTLLHKGKIQSEVFDIKD